MLVENILKNKIMKTNTKYAIICNLILMSVIALVVLFFRNSPNEIVNYFSESVVAICIYLLFAFNLLAINKGFNLEDLFDK